MTFQEFIAEYQLTCTATFISVQDDYFKWEVQIRKGTTHEAYNHPWGKYINIPYSMGLAHCRRTTVFSRDTPRTPVTKAIARALKPFGLLTDSDLEGYVTPTQPSLCLVLERLQLDCQAPSFGSFESWADNYGYDPYSQAAERIYKECLDLHAKLLSLLGYSGMAALLDCSPE